MRRRAGTGSNIGVPLSLLHSGRGGDCAYGGQFAAGALEAPVHLTTGVRASALLCVAPHCPVQSAERSQSAKATARSRARSRPSPLRSDSNRPTPRTVYPIRCLGRGNIRGGRVSYSFAIAGVSVCGARLSRVACAAPAAWCGSLSLCTVYAVRHVAGVGRRTARRRGEWATPLIPHRSVYIYAMRHAGHGPSKRKRTPADKPNSKGHYCTATKRCGSHKGEQGARRMGMLAPVAVAGSLGSPAGSGRGRARSGVSSGLRSGHTVLLLHVLTTWYMCT